MSDTDTPAPPEELSQVQGLCNSRGDEPNGSERAQGQGLARAGKGVGWADQAISPELKAGPAARGLGVHRHLLPFVDSPRADAEEEGPPLSLRLRLMKGIQTPRPGM